MSGRKVCLQAEIQNREMRQLLSAVEKRRLHVSKNTEAMKKSQLGQFFTPERTAVFMAGLFSAGSGHCHLLDAGAGIGSLSAAFLDRCFSGVHDFEQIELDAFEIDQVLHSDLRQTFEKYANKGVNARVHGVDFIHSSVDSISRDLFAAHSARYTHAILNPPYKKLHSDSAHRLALRRVGIEAVNLYSAFVALAVAQMVPGGQVVAIVPRSFCNGPYYRPFRDYILERAAIRRIHLFESRDKAFKDDDVLQENVILLLERESRQESVVVSTSTDDAFSDLGCHEHPFERIVVPGDPERFIHVPTSPGPNAIELLSSIRHSLVDLGIKVSTGPVVDFRLSAHLRDMPEPGTVPLLYPSHFVENGIAWPIVGSKKPNAIARNANTEKWLYPSGFYCVVRRFSSKEERRRIVASVVDPSRFKDAPMLGFENHLNVLHENKSGMPEPLAHGLAMFLNTTAVDEHFRRFNGHTQVNATDLKMMKFPSRNALIKLGQWAMRQKNEITQDQIDEQLRALAA